MAEQFKIKQLERKLTEAWLLAWDTVIHFPVLYVFQSFISCHYCLSPVFS